MLINDISTLGKLVRDVRERAGLTQAETADLIGVGRRFVVELESGKRAASITTVLKVLRFLGLELHAVPRGSGRTLRTPARSTIQDS